MTEFQRNAEYHVSRLKKKKSLLVLTINGRAELVVQDAQGYQLDWPERAEAVTMTR